MTDEMWLPHPHQVALSGEVLKSTKLFFISRKDTDLLHDPQVAFLHIL